MDSSPTGRESFVLRKEESKVTLSVPKHKELKPGLLRNLIKAAGLTLEDFEKML
ncbi:MAG: type II toxin-antitoxin system HicA family toxin [Candidatus Methanoperedens sp.]|nr:type II toxin-antitoxin system HicA family toxin [Candidatus Methanoperedens sp.]